MSHIFISHSSKDALTANQLVEYLESQGHKCWIAPRDIPAGHDYTDVINDALEGCHTLVFLISPHSLESQWVKKEIAAAMTLNKRVLPFKIARCQLSSGYLFMLNNVQIIDAVDFTNNKFHLLLNELNGIHIAPAITQKKKNKTILTVTITSIVILIFILILILLPNKTSDDLLKKDAPIVEEISDTNKTLPEPIQTNNTESEPKINVKTEQKSNTKKETKTEKEEASTASGDRGSATTMKEEKEQTKKIQENTPPKDNSQAEYDIKFNTAYSLYKGGFYDKALDDFEKLLLIKPDDSQVIGFIKDCKRKLKQ